MITPNWVTTFQYKIKNDFFSFRGKHCTFNNFQPSPPFRIILFQQRREGMESITKKDTVFKRFTSKRRSFSHPPPLLICSSHILNFPFSSSSYPFHRPSIVFWEIYTSALYRIFHGFILFKYRFLCTVCPGRSDPFYIVTYYIKWVTTSWTYSITCITAMGTLVAPICWVIPPASPSYAIDEWMNELIDDWMKEWR